MDGFTYGALYPYAGVLLTSLCGFVSPVSDSTIIIILRTISLVAALITGACTFLIARNLYGDLAGLIASTILLSSTLVYKWTIEIHPDLLQLCFLTASLYSITLLARQFSFKRVILCSLFAGIAMGTKYGGVFLVPTIGLALLLGIDEDFPRTLRDRRFGLGALCASAVFVSAFVLTNPYTLLNPCQFVTDLEFTRQIVSDTTGNAISWIWMLFNPGTGIIFGMGILVTVSHLTRREWRSDRSTACLLFWIISYLGFLLTSVHFIAGQYLLPLVPALSIIVGKEIHGYTVRTKHSGILAWIIASVTVIVQVIYTLPIYADRTRDNSDNPVVAAGLWLSDTYGPETTILYDTYAYVPSEFTLAETFFGLSYPVIRIFKPDLVITRRSIRERYRNPDKSDHFRLTDDTTKQADFLYLSPQRYRDIHYTYNYLEHDLTAYTVVRDFDDVTVYRKRQRAEEDDSKERWECLSAAHKGAGVEPGLAAKAYSDFGDTHSRAGNWAEAKIQYAKAIQLNGGDIIPRYAYALALAHQDSFDTAESQIERLSSLTSEPADLWIKLGWDYYEMRQYERSRKASRRAHRLSPDRPFPLFNVALTFLAEDRARDADTAYRVALERYPLPSETRELLSRMITEGNLKGERRDVAERVLSTQDK